VDLDIPGLPELIKDLKELAGSHSEYVEKAKKLGLPVLKEGEIGIPKGMAAKIPVQAEGVETNLAELIKKQEKVFVETIRYPFTGTLSVQPHVAKILAGELGKQVIAAPGAPELDIDKLKKVIDTLKEYIGVVPRDVEGKLPHLPEGTLTLIEQREAVWASAVEDSAEKAAKLTMAIEGLLRAVSAATPKFTNLEQKLDFDSQPIEYFR
ncbi:unnamed protein product, partial [marine sediment metagenome]